MELHQVPLRPQRKSRSAFRTGRHARLTGSDYRRRSCLEVDSFANWLPDPNPGSQNLRISSDPVEGRRNNFAVMKYGKVLFAQRRLPSSYMLTFDDGAQADPIARFREWLLQAESTEPNDPNAAALATATASGEPSVRMVLVKRVDERGFCFFTNAESEKGIQLAENPRASLCFHWKSLRRQVRVTGSVTGLEASEVDSYFHSRSRKSQISAAVSAQSRPLQSQDVLVNKVNAFANQYPGEIPRPAYWRGYCVFAEKIEFWIDGADRLHDRILFTRSENGWVPTRLFP